MRPILVLLAFLLVLQPCAAQEQKADEKGAEEKNPKLIYPSDLLNPYSNLKTIDEPSIKADKEEFVEIESESYPGLVLQLPEPEEMLSFHKFELLPTQRPPNYYEDGNPVLTYYGIHEPGGTLLSTPIPLEKEEEKKKKE